MIQKHTNSHTCCSLDCFVNNTTDQIQKLASLSRSLSRGIWQVSLGYTIRLDFIATVGNEEENGSSLAAVAAVVAAKATTTTTKLSYSRHNGGQYCYCANFVIRKWAMFSRLYIGSGEMETGTIMRKWPMFAKSQQDFRHTKSRSQESPLADELESGNIKIYHSMALWPLKAQAHPCKDTPPNWPLHCYEMLQLGSSYNDLF